MQRGVLVAAWIVHEVAVVDIYASGVERVLVVAAAAMAVVVGGVGLLLLPATATGFGGVADGC